LVITKEVNILDCTLRDGGYLNNWQFSREETVKIIKTLNSTGIEYLECGYLGTNSAIDEGTLFSSLEKFSELVELVENHSNKLMLMINHREFDPKKITKNDFVSGIRYAFSKKDLPIIFRNVSLLSENGYQIFLQPMNTESYSDEELEQLIDLSNLLEPEVLYIVDSFGSLFPEKLLEIYSFLAKKLKKKINIGFHPHNNLRLAFANTKSLIDFKEKNDSNRNLIIDSTIGGVGRGAGNLETEVLILYLKQKGKNYQYQNLLDFIDEEKTFLGKKNISENLLYFFSGLIKCHPNYVTALSKEKIPLKKIIEFLENLDDQKKSVFNHLSKVAF